MYQNVWNSLFDEMAIEFICTVLFNILFEKNTLVTKNVIAALKTVLTLADSSNEVRAT